MTTTSSTKPVYDKAYIQNLIQTNDQAVIRGLLAIYSRQTADEQNTQATKEHNNKGFNGCDATILSSFAEWYSAKGYLSPKQIAISRRKLMRYHKQLLQIAEEKGAKVSYKVPKVAKAPVLAHVAA